MICICTGRGHWTVWINFWCKNCFDQNWSQHHDSGDRTLLMWSQINMRDPWLIFNKMQICAKFQQLVDNLFYPVVCLDELTIQKPMILWNFCMCISICICVHVWLYLWFCVCNFARIVGKSAFIGATGNVYEVRIGKLSPDKLRHKLWPKHCWTKHWYYFSCFRCNLAGYIYEINQEGFQHSMKGEIMKNVGDWCEDC